MAMLKRVMLNGFKSIKSMDLELRSLNVLIGANGAGKSNFVSFFKMLHEMMGGRLQQYIGTSGRAQSLLYLGPKLTPQLEATLDFEADNSLHTYFMRLVYAAGDTLSFAEEQLGYVNAGQRTLSSGWLESGQPESRISQMAGWNGTGQPEKIYIGQIIQEENRRAKLLRNFLNRCRVFHFHDTSFTARVRQFCYVGDARWLLPDAGNLAAVLYRLRNEGSGAAYHPIVSTIRLIAPFFDDFDLDPGGPGKKDLILNWRQKGTDQLFGPHQLSDGTLRAICLVTLLMLPQDELPDLIIVDEPELGLHPYALNVLAALFRKISCHTQIMISTQSTSFLDNFNLEDVIVVNREGMESKFIRPDAEKLAAWLEEYSLGEVWEKNVIGGGPH